MTLPNGVKVKAVDLLRSDKTIPFRLEDSMFPVLLFGISAEKNRCY
jgi:hypothetical protein